MLPDLTLQQALKWHNGGDYQGDYVAVRDEFSFHSPEAPLIPASTSNRIASWT